MRTAVVTGVTGFIGRHLVDALLEKNVEVWAVVRDKRKIENMREQDLHVIEADLAKDPPLEEQIRIRDIDVCYHLAWDGTWGEAFKDYALQLQNAKCACDMAVKAAMLGCRRFVLVSTIVQLEAQKYMLEDSGRPRYSCIYGTAKSAAALLCRIEASRLGMGWNTAVLSSVYGEGDRSQMIENVVIQNFLSGKRPKLVTGDNQYDCTYVDDVVAGLIAIVERGRPDKTYYVGHRKLRTFRDIVSEIRDVLAPEMELKFGEYPDATPIDYSLINVDALYHDTGFEPKISLKEGISRTAAWLKENKKDG